MLITLLTDFGTADYFVGAMKGVILSRAPGARVVDLTHEIAPQDVAAGAFTLLAAYGEFPPGTVHVGVVDPGVGSERRAVVVAAGGQLFVGPDNGLFSWICDREPEARAYRITNERFFRAPVSTTFHGRDIFAPVAAALAMGAAPEEVGEALRDPERLPPLAPHRDGAGAVRGRILHVDRFGNCVTNLTPSEMDAGLAEGSLALEVGGHLVRSLRRHYAGAAEGEVFAIWGSAGFLELAANRGSAAALLGVRAGDEVGLRGGEGAW